MVPIALIRIRRCPLVLALFLATMFCGTAPAAPADKTANNANAAPWPELLLEGGRKLTFERTIRSEKDIRGKTGFWTKLANIVVGEPDQIEMARPYAIAQDSKGRLIVTDPGMSGVHIFDLEQHKYKFLQRDEMTKDELLEPQCVAVDAHDNIYVTDSKAGKIFVWNANLKYRGALGSKKGEGFFKRPTGIAIDPKTQNIYVTDTLRDRLFVLNQQGEVLRVIGKHGDGLGEFYLPTHVMFASERVVVVDAMNFRVQIFDREGNYLSSIGRAGDSSFGIYRPKGVAMDSEGHIYIAEGEWGLVQVFDLEGNLLYHFGNGTGFADFQVPSGLFIDRNDRVYVVDSLNERVQVFKYQALKTASTGRNQ